MGTSSVCEKCGKEMNEEERYEYKGRGYCDDCYMEVLSPTKACDPWAVYAARSSLQGRDKFSELTPAQRAIVDFVRSKDEVTAKEVTERFGMTEEEFKREFAVLRHMEVLKGVKKGMTVAYALFDA